MSHSAGLVATPRGRTSGFRRVAAGIGRATLLSGACLLAGTVIVALVVIFTEDTYGENPPDRVMAMLFFDLVVGVVANVAVGPMRRAGAWNLLLLLPSIISSSACPAVMVALIRVGAQRRRRLDLTALAMFAVLAALGEIISVRVEGTEGGAEDWWALLLGYLFILAVGSVALLWGHTRGTRAALVESLRRQVGEGERARAALAGEHEALEREHRALVAQAEAEQRTAIARDMHDSLAHHLSLVALNAGALAYRADLPPERMRDVARTICDDARAANSELRQVLTALREDDAQPLPTAATLVEMVARERSLGARVELTWEEVEAAGLDAAGSTTVVTLARVTRELLTNARKHAPDEPLRLTISRCEERVMLRAINPVPSRDAVPASKLGTGMGLVGVRERVRLLGGDLRVHDPRSTGRGDYEVEVWLPWAT